MAVVQPSRQPSVPRLPPRIPRRRSTHCRVSPPELHAAGDGDLGGSNERITITRKRKDKDNEVGLCFTACRHHHYGRLEHVLSLFFYNCFWWTHFRQLVIATSQIGYIWEQFQMLYTWFQLYLNYFNTAVDDVLMSHLTEPTPYMRQVLSPAAYMGR